MWIFNMANVIECSNCCLSCSVRADVDLEVQTVQILV
jgi:hypothetical protein